MSVKTAEPLPFRLGRVGPLYSGLVVLFLIVLGVGVYAYSRQVMEGEVVTGMRDIGTMGGAAWGLYIAFVVYFVGVSFAGITTAALIRVLNLEHLRPIARMAEFLTVIALVLGAFSVLADVGNVGRAIINLLRYARPQSPFFGTFSLVISGYLIASMVYLYLDGRKDAAILARRPSKLQGFYRAWAAGYRDTPQDEERHLRASWWLSLSIIPLLITAHSTLGFVFGLQGGAAGWYSALQAPGFVVLAGVSGIATIILIAVIARLLLNLGQQLPLSTFAWLSNFLWVLIVVYLYLMIVEVLTGTYGGHHHEVRTMQSLLFGPYAWLFWSSVGLLLTAFFLLFVQSMRRSYSLPLMVVAALMAELATVLKRYLIVVPSQTHGRLLPYLNGSYSPTWVEYAVVLGLMALGVLAFLVFFKVFPIMHVPEEGRGR